MADDAKDVVASTPTSSTWCQSSAALLEAGDYEQALWAANQAVEADRANAWAYCHRAAVWGRLGQGTLAIRDMETALERDPTNAKIDTELQLTRLAFTDVVKEPFGDAKYEPMGKAHGTWVVGNVEVASTFQCPHAGCGGSHFVSMRGSGRRRVFCFYCGTITCGSPACDPCVPYLKVLEEIARAAQ